MDVTARPEDAGGTDSAQAKGFLSSGDHASCKQPEKQEKRKNRKCKLANFSTVELFFVFCFLNQGYVLLGTVL